MVKTNTDKQRIASLEKEVTELRKTISWMNFEFGKVEGGASVHQIWLKDLRERLETLEKEVAKKKKPKKKKEGWMADYTPEQIEEAEREWRGY